MTERMNSISVSKECLLHEHLSSRKTCHNVSTISHAPGCVTVNLKTASLRVYSITVLYNIYIFIEIGFYVLKYQYMILLNVQWFDF